MDLEDYAEFCYDQTGSVALRIVPYFQDYKMLLTQANIDISLPEYLSLGIFTTGLISAFVFSIFGLIFFLSSGLTGLLTAFFITLFISIISASLLYFYPKTLVSSRATVIRDMMPFATMYLSTLAGTGNSVSEIFTKLADVEEYDEVATEAEKISRDIETLGMDVSEALERGADRTPSEDLEDLLRGLEHVITTGGSVREFLNQRSDALMDDYQRRIEKFADQLGLLVEMYITVVIVGSIIFTAMSAIMSSFTGFDPTIIVAIQVILVFLGLPIITGMFIIFIKGISPGGVM
ncbi:MAG: archaeal flagella assembly protein J [Candidatus Nanosalina sp. J07AB43]|nr:MAG: archaeal flagella assembly protein J [Candidatus Nanosalina sp. J07AB43]